MWDNEERVTCDHCKHCGSWRNPCQHRIDHDRVKLYHPHFKSYDHRMPYPCSDFEPASWCKYICKSWEGFDAYCKGYKETWGQHKMFYEGLTWVYLNGHLWDEFDAPIYAVETKEMVFGKPYDFKTGFLKAVKKKYHKRCKKSAERPLGFYTVVEDVDGIYVTKGDRHDEQRSY